MKGTDPSKSTQCQEILAWLEQGKPLTQMMAIDKFGCMRLGARIHDLRNAGHNITCKLINVVNRHGDTCRVAEYRMEVQA